MSHSTMEVEIPQNSQKRSSLKAELNGEIEEKQMKSPRMSKAIVPLNTSAKVDSPPFRSVIKFHVSRVDVDYDSPWKRKDEVKTGGTGFALMGKILVTNEHVVHEHNYVRVTKPGCATKFRAQVACVAPEVDLAIVTVEDEVFWKDLPLLKRQQCFTKTWMQRCLCWISNWWCWFVDYPWGCLSSLSQQLPCGMFKDFNRSD
eukprot:TRINITY_DN5617_c0_g1_i1.p1 TRINITY_DN5617_c0_g1~~TRINITY_DN5617_c0_g1_i1.p1  ORF type:complete len:202 (-),score=31.83 TRINITY_DN5617_c0_g1_i1:579-1184(-)